MEEDDMDFTPSPNTSSNLASLFGFTKKPLQGNSSLTYTAPKAPKGDSNVAKKSAEEKTKSKIIFSNAVQAYKLEKRTYISLGLIGLAISGNHESRNYEIIFYKRNKEHICQIRISSSFLITLSPNNYVSFYDNNKQNWSLMFLSPGEVEQFSQKVAICKFYSCLEPPKEPLIQDLGPPSQSKASCKSTVEIVYTCYTLTPDEISKVKEDIKTTITLSSYGFVQFSKSLIGCAENCKRLIIIPHSLSDPWIELKPNKDLLLEVKLEKIFPEEEDVMPKFKVSTDGSESPVDSSAKETSVKAKGASVKEALPSPKSQKANLISRMARMGQATLPVKPKLCTEQSDSEEESLSMSSPKPRIPRTRVPANNSFPNSNASQIVQNAEASQQVSVYQNDLSWHQSQLGKPVVGYQQLIPMSAGSLSSPTTDSNLSVFFSESRIQAAELRMGVSKISEKLDLIWNKIQNMSGTSTESKVHQIALMDSAGILTSIQNLITENESLKGKAEEQKEKIEQQNDRIFHLLELNHKYLEQNSTNHEKQSASECKLRAEMESLQKREGELESSYKKTLDRMRVLTEDLAKSEESNSVLNKRVEEMNGEIETLKKIIKENNESQGELENLREKLSKAAETITKVENIRKEIVSENDTLKSLIKAQKEEIETGNEKIKNSETKQKEYEEAVESLQRQISDEETKTESKIERLVKMVAKLEDENKRLLEAIENRADQNNLKTVLPQVLSALKQNFQDSEEYSSSHIITSIERIFNSIIDGRFVHEEKREAISVVPAPRKSLQNVESSEKEKKIETETAVKHEKDDAKESSDAKEVGETTQTNVTKEGTEGKEEKGASKSAEEIKAKESDPTSSSRLVLEAEVKDEEKNNDQKKKEEIDSRYKSYDQGWRTTKPPPPPLFDDEDDFDDWLM